MKFIKFTQPPIQICGLPAMDIENGHFWRISDESSSQVSNDVRERSKAPVGGRIRFKTDSKILHIKVSVQENNPDPCIPMTGSVGLDVFSGAGVNCRFIGSVAPVKYGVCEFDETFELDLENNENITINLLRNCPLKMIEIGIDDSASVSPPDPYTLQGKICFYGSSITEGGCASRPGNAYTSIVSRWLDIDYINYGFSGSAKGEPAMADIICRDKYRIIVMDYDHNAPDVNHLANTHEPFFKKLRASNPRTPIILISRPDFDYEKSENIKRRDIIYKTFLNAKEAGDKYIDFIDGETLFGKRGRECCKVENIHPNDLGHMRMAEHIFPMLEYWSGVK